MAAFIGARSLKRLSSVPLSLNGHLSEIRLHNLDLLCYTRHATAINGAFTSNRLVYNSSSRKRWKCTKEKVPEDRVLPPLKVKRYAYDKLVNFMNASMNNLETKFPRPFEVYRTFRSGFSVFREDTKQFYSISTRLWGGESLRHLTRRQLELYRQFSSDLPVMGLVLLIAFAPGGAFIFPIAFMYPRFLLSPHFWSQQQTEYFRRIEASKRVKHFPKVLDCFYVKAELCGSEDQIKKVVSKLDTSVSLSLKDMEALLPLFDEKPYSLDTMSLKYRWHLSKSLGLSMRKKKLLKEAMLIHFIDVALLREGIHTLSQSDLDRACAWRGLSPEGMEREAKLAYLKTWAEITKDVHEPNISLLLHLPILLGYCQPSNRKLMARKGKKPSRQQFEQ